MQDTHTWHEIVSQPQAWRGTLAAFAEHRDDLTGFLQQSSFDRIVVTGCGSTHYLAMAAAASMAGRAEAVAAALPASEIWLSTDELWSRRTLLVAVSRSGSTTETLRAVGRFRTSGGAVLAVTCYPNSPLAAQADFVLAAPDAQEQSVAQTRSFSSMLLLTQALTATLAGDRRMLEMLARLPDALAGLDARLGDVPEQLGSDRSIERIFFLGRGPLYGIASEAMLKTKEMSLSYAEAYYPLEFRHGPMSMVDEHTLVVGLVSDAGLAQERDVLAHMQRLGARTLALVEGASVLEGRRPDALIELQSGLDEWARQPLYLPPLQRMAYHRAVAKGLNPDRPTHLEAVVEL
jgi:glucosamine--fructose-6-phosphate aminotransferase (isomerizing)